MMRTKRGQRGKLILSDPVPTKFFRNDLDWLDLVARRSGLGRAEVVRRSVRLLAAAVEANPKWNWVKETADELPPLTEQQRADLGGAAQSDGVNLPGLDGRVHVQAGAGKKFDEANTRAKADSEADRKRRPRRTRS